MPNIVVGDSRGNRRGSQTLSPRARRDAEEALASPPLQIRTRGVVTRPSDISFDAEASPGPGGPPPLPPPPPPSPPADGPEHRRRPSSGRFRAVSPADREQPPTDDPFGDGVAALLALAQSTDSALRGCAYSALSALSASGELLAGLTQPPQQQPEDADDAVTDDELAALLRLVLSRNGAVQSVAVRTLAKLHRSGQLPPGQLATSAGLARIGTLFDTRHPSLRLAAVGAAARLAGIGVVWRDRLARSGLLAQMLQLLEAASAELVRALCGLIGAYSEDGTAVLEARPDVVQLLAGGALRRFSGDLETQQLVAATLFVPLRLTPRRPPVADEALLDGSDSLNALLGELSASVRRSREAETLGRRKSRQRDTDLGLTWMSVTAACVQALGAAAASAAVATAVVDRAHAFGLMDALTYLFRASPRQLPRARALVATLLQQLCEHADNARKGELCASGALVRLIRLASPTAYEAPWSAENLGVQMSALEALTSLCSVPELGARVVVAGGLAALFAHANSCQLTRPTARRALDLLGVDSLTGIVDAWSSTRLATEKRRSAAGFQVTLLSLTRADGTPLVMDESSLRPLPPSRELYLPADELGVGGFATVYRAELDGVGPVALKRLNAAASADPAFLREVEIQATVRPHPCIVALHGVVPQTADGRTTLVMDLGGRDLRAVAAELGWAERLRAALDIAEGLAHLHSQAPPVLHLDVKAANVLLPSSSLSAEGGGGHYRLCDFGLAVQARRGLDFVNPANHGTLQWMAPEVMTAADAEISQGFGAAADVYSFGVFLWELAHPGRVPWDHVTVAEIRNDDISMLIRQRVCDGERPPCDPAAVDEWPAGFHRLMTECWAPQPAARPVFAKSFLDEAHTEVVAATLRCILRGLG